LMSSSIWGRCIDLNDLRKTTYDWFREVLSRAGNALLWIMGPIRTYSYYGTPDPPDFLLVFINENWNHIQRFNISDSVRSADAPGEYGDRAEYWSTLFKKPAPILKEFVFHYTAREDYIGDEKERWILPTPLFNATSPALKKFEVYRTTRSELNAIEFTMDMPASWLSKLRSFTLRQGVNVGHLLELLAMAPLLEDLEINGLSASAKFPASNVSVVNLPKLTSICLKSLNPLGHIVAFLEGITPALGCCLSMCEPGNSGVIVDTQYVKRVQVLIMRYVQSYFNHHPPTRIALSCNAYLELKETSISGHPNPSGLSIWMPLGVDDSSLIEMLFNAPFMSTVIDLDIRRWRKALPFPLSVFDSVSTLWIEYESLCSLSEHVQQGHDLIFPHLDVLRVGHWELYLGSEYREPLGLFLRDRWAISRPISVLYLYPGHQDLVCDLDDLENLTGLRVKWKPWLGGNIEEYVCGNGHPETLCFKKNFPGNALSIPDFSGFAIDTVIYGWSGQIADI